MMFSTTAGKLAAQKQADIFDVPEPAADFELVAPVDDPAIRAATKNGATFEKRGADWFALAHRRGRPVALASFVSPTQSGAAAMFCDYFRIKV